MGKCWICGKEDKAGSIIPGRLVQTDLEICRACWVSGAKDLTVRQYLDLVRLHDSKSRAKNLN
jgi:hypothetical protein